jgi:glycosyltransferase involved in cell wall biosynthesis
MSMTIHGSGEFNDPVGFALAAKVAASRFVCAISSFGRSQLMKSCDPADWSKIEVSLLGVDAAAFRPRPFCESPDVFEILWVGSLTPARGQRLLVNAAGELLRQGRRLRLHLVGDGEDRAALEAHAAALGLHDAVVFHGWLNQDQVRSLYERADLFALASFAEGIPVVLMEAMAMEIPCVATYIAGIPELIRDGESGLLVHASDAAALAAAIARLMDQPELRRQLGKAGREKVLVDFDLATNMAKLAGIFRQRLVELRRI